MEKCGVGRDISECTFSFLRYAGMRLLTQVMLKNNGMRVKALRVCLFLVMSSRQWQTPKPQLGSPDVLSECQLEQMAGFGFRFMLVTDMPVFPIAAAVGGTSTLDPLQFLIEEVYTMETKLRKVCCPNSPVWIECPL